MTKVHFRGARAGAFFGSRFECWMRTGSRGRSSISVSVLLSHLFRVQLIVLLPQVQHVRRSPLVAYAVGARHRALRRLLPTSYTQDSHNFSIGGFAKLWGMRADGRAHLCDFVRFWQIPQHLLGDQVAEPSGA